MLRHLETRLLEDRKPTIALQLTASTNHSFSSPRARCRYVFNGSQRKLHDLRDLVVTMAFDMSQEDDRAVLGPQLADGTFDLGTQLTVLNVVLRCLSLARTTTVVRASSSAVPACGEP